MSDRRVEFRIERAGRRGGRGEDAAGDIALQHRLLLGRQVGRNERKSARSGRLAAMAWSVEAMKR